MVDTSGIHSLVARGRRRLRLQAALDGATLASIAASPLALAAVYLLRRSLVSDEVGIGILAGAVLLVAVGAVVAATRAFPTELVATRIDRASGLADRLATACAFEPQLKAPGKIDPETLAMMQLAIADAVRAAPRAQVKLATPFAWPRDGRAALAFAAVCGVLAALATAPQLTAPALTRAVPGAAPRNISIDLVGDRLCGADDDRHNADSTCVDPSAIKVWFGNDETHFVAAVTSAKQHRLAVRVPEEIIPGRKLIWVKVDGERALLPLPFEVLRDGDKRYQAVPRVALDDDDQAFARDRVEELKRTAEATQDVALTQLAKDIEQLLDKADKGEISKEQLLDELAKAEQKYNEGASEKDVKEAIGDLKDTGKQLQKSELTKPIGDALEQGDLTRAQEEMKKLADKLDKGELSDKQRQEAAKAMEKAAEAFDKKDQQRTAEQDKKIQKADQEAKQLEQKLKQAKNDTDRQKLQQKLEDKQRQLKQLSREKQEQDASEQKRTLKRLHHNMKEAAQDLKRDASKQENRKEASRKMEDMARDTGKVDSDQRKMNNQKKVASQLGDLKEAMRRAKQGGSRGPKDRFGRNRRNDDFNQRARGGQGSREAWQRGQGQGQGQNGNQPGGNGKQPGGEGYGTQHDPGSLLGQATPKNGSEKDQGLTGVHGKGASTRETILAAAQQGFSSQQYRDAYTRYRTIVEEVINNEKVPSGYKYYVKKYFQKIKPQ